MLRWLHRQFEASVAVAMGAVVMVAELVALAVVVVMVAELVALVVVVVLVVEMAAEMAMPDKPSHSIDTVPQSSVLQECHDGT